MHNLSFWVSGVFAAGAVVLSCAGGSEGSALDEAPMGDEAEAGSVEAAVGSGLSAAGPERQFFGGFRPRAAPYGGFGGGACTATRTPIIMLHGNSSEAKFWDYETRGEPSVYRVLKSAGYNDCELFGVNYLAKRERELSVAGFNYHNRERARIVVEFVRDVLAYTGAKQVDIVGHSMGVTAGLHGVEYGHLWPRVRRFVAMGGALRGLDLCFAVGYANPAFPGCGSQNWIDPEIFGFFPGFGLNPRMQEGGYRDLPQGKSTRFYVITAGYHDQASCNQAVFGPSCWKTNVFDPHPAVRATLHVGYGALPTDRDDDYSQDGSPYNGSGGDLDGIGHVWSKVQGGPLLARIFQSDCEGESCCCGYGHYCRALRDGAEPEIHRKDLGPPAVCANVDQSDVGTQQGEQSSQGG